MSSCSRLTAAKSQPLGPSLRAHRLANRKPGEAASVSLTRWFCAAFDLDNH